ncbi:MAG: D-xylose ABC transporter substrate-binding protein [bacterium]
MVFLAGCALKGPKKIKVGFSMDTLKEERWQKDRDLFIKRVEELGGEVVVQVANSNDQLQNEQAENLLTLGVDVLVVVPHNGKTAAAIVESAHKSNTKVMAYDRIINDCDLDLYISFDNVKVGELQAEYLVKNVPKGNYVLIGGSPVDFNAILFRKGQMNILKPLIEKKDINIIADQWARDWQPIEALKHTENALTKSDNNINAVLTSNDGCAGGAVQALAEQKLAGKVAVTGQDADLAACQRIIKGTQSMTVYKPIKELAYAAAEAAMAMAKNQSMAKAVNKINNGKIDVPSILLDPVSVDKSNLEETVIKNGYLKKEDVYGDI